MGSSLGVQQVKDLALSLQWLRLLPWPGFDACPRNFHKPQVWPKKKRKNCSEYGKFDVFFGGGVTPFKNNNNFPSRKSTKAGATCYLES